MFSSDVVAFEAQSAPLWENVKKHDAESSPRVRETASHTQSQQKRHHSPPPGLLCDSKRPKIMLQFTECKLCELKFKSELELEEHLFSILHHRALNTEKGGCQHECNLCRVKCENLTDYVAHLTSDSHKNLSTSRKTSIDNGEYLHPKNCLSKYTATFMCLPRKAKQLQMSDESKKNSKPTSPLKNSKFEAKYDNKPARYLDEERDNRYTYPRHGGEQPSHPSYWRDGDRFDSSYDSYEYPDWHPMGHYGGYDERPNNCHDYREMGYDLTSSNYNRSSKNPYAQGWIERLPRNAYTWQRPDYHKNVRNQERLSKSIESLPKSSQHYRSPRFENDIKNGHARSLTNDQARTKQLVARAHKVIQSGQNMSSRQTSEKNRHSPHLSTSSSSTKSQLGNKKTKSKSRKNNQSKHKGVSQTIPSIGRVTSAVVCEKKKEEVACEKKKASKMRKVGGRDPNLSCINEDKIKKGGISKKLEKWQNLKRAVSLDNLLKPEELSKFREQIDFEILDGGKKRGRRKKMTSNVTKNNQINTDDDPLSNTNNSEKHEDYKQPNSAETIRAEFRKILDEIDQPVASASEILQNIANHGNENNNVNSPIQTIDAPSWTHSSEVISISTDTLTDSNNTFSEQPTQNNTVNSGVSTRNLDGFTPDTTQYTSLPEPLNYKSQRVLSTQTSRSHSVDLVSEKSTLTNPNTPVHEILSSAGEQDTPNMKNRIHPQPNITKARSRLSAKHKDSPDQPFEVRQAKLKKLLQKYDRTKKNSPDVGNSASKKTAGPRFGIDLHLRNESNENAEMESIAKTIELVELFPEKRTRSLSESDSILSFATAGTSSVANIIPENEVHEELGKNGRNTEISMQSPVQQNGTPNPMHSVPSDPLSQSLNSKLLHMSEREEKLHASVRSLAVQEANVQSDIESKIDTLRLLYTEVEKLKERKMCIDALKRKNEQDLESLRQERLILLRGTVNGSHPNDNPIIPGPIFQDVIPNSRRTSFTGSSFTHSTPIPNQNTNSAGLIPNGNSSPCANGFPISTEITQNMGLPAVSHANDPTSFVPIPHNQMQHSFNPDLSKVKTEQDLDDNLPFIQYSSKAHHGIPATSGIKQEPVSGKTSEALNLPRNDLQQSQLNGDIEQGQNSTQFYSICDDTHNNTTLSVTSAEVDRILSKYSKSKQQTNANTSNGSMNLSNNSTSPGIENLRTKQKRRKMTPKVGLRRSPRFLSKQSPVKPTCSEVSSTSKTNGDSCSENFIGDASTGRLEVFPKIMKAHNLPLVGMQLVNQGLVTCSLDETVAIHGSNGIKISEKLDASPTALAATSDGRNTVVFVATQKIISSTLETNDSHVINKMEHWLNIYSTFQNQSFAMLHRIKMKTRVLCLHYDINYIFCGMRDGMTAIISVDDNFKPDDDINIIECHSCSAITCLTTGREGPRRILCSGSTDCTVSVRDATDGLLLRTIQGHMKTVTCVQLVRNELFSASVDRKVLGHDLITGNLLHRFMGHVGVVRSLSVTGGKMVTLCSDRNIRFFDVKMGRLLQSPTNIASLPMFSCIQINGGATPPGKCAVFIGCEDGMVIRLPFPNGVKPVEDIQGKSPVKSPQSNDLVNLIGDYACRWAGCTGADTFSDLQSLRDHVFGVHVHPNDLTEYALDRSTATLSFGTCCQWENCTHYFAPELDTITDVQNHVQRHIKNTENNNNKRLGASQILSTDSDDIHVIT